MRVQGLRERNKLQKEERIRSTARRLFAERGFEQTTLRDVAAQADVGFGTVFDYAVDKAGLLAMVFVEELKSLPALFDGIVERADPMDELIEGLEKLYEFWARTPVVSHQVLNQMEFYTDNPHMARILARRSAAQAEITNWIRKLQTQGRAMTDIHPELAAASLFAIYTSSVREWAGNVPLNIPQGLTRLRELMSLPMRGLLVSHT